MINTIVFDLGKVLVDFKWEDIYRKYFNDEEFNKVAKATILHENIWKHLDKNDISYQEVMNKIKDLEPILFPKIELAIQEMYDTLIPYDYSYNWLKKLNDDGYNIYLLSNFGEIPYLKSKEKFTFMEFVLGQVISYEIKEIKPDSKIYQYLLDKYNIVSDNAVFIDDVLENIEAANKLGFKTILFDNYNNASNKLDTLLKDK